MFLADYHLHTNRSFDGDLNILVLCQRAIEVGLHDIAITDHCDCNEEVVQYSYEDCYEDILLAREQFGSKLNLRFGIELGQPTQNLAFSNHLLEKSSYDFVLGSLHNLKSQEDFYFLNFENLDIKKLINRYFDELYELCDWGRFDVLGHLDYPARYILKQNIPFDIMDYKEQIEAVLKKLINNSKGIEVNTSGIRNILNRTMPQLEVIKLYKQLGGEIITVGSDAHHKEHIGMNIENGLNVIKEAGFQYITIFENRKAIFEKITL